jgi:hypothetical protein
MKREIAELLYRHILIIKEKTGLPIAIIDYGEEYCIVLPSWPYLDDDDTGSIISGFYDVYREKGINAGWGVSESVVADDLELIESVIFSLKKA